ncbi:MAG: DUF4923 family protein [Flavobacteriales bacterium]|nr:DUF4923 family protein [Flavobacteriales bacterium]
MRLFLAFILISSFTISSRAQTVQTDLAGFFGKKWVTSVYEIQGERYPASDILAGDGSMFNADGTFSSVDKGVASKGKWAYDAKERILTAHTEGYDEPNRLRVISISGDKAILQSVQVEESHNEHQGHAMTIHLKVEN